MTTPIHLWFVAVASLLWNLMGVVDYSMTQMHNPAYMAQFTPEQVAYFTNQPAWFVGFWALAVWSALLGSVLLLMRRRSAVIVFALSLAAMVVTMFHTYVLSAVPFSSVAGPEAKWFSSAIFLAAMGLWFYARWMRKARVLR